MWNKEPFNQTRGYPTWREADSLPYSGLSNNLLCKLQFLVLLNESNSVLNMRFYRITAPKGIRDSFAILKHCSPTGMPMTVMQQIRPQTR